MYAPFVKMIQFALEPLLLSANSGADSAESTLPAISKLMRTLKNTEDNTDEPQV